MSESDYSNGGPDVNALVGGRIPREMTATEREEAIGAGAGFATAVAGDEPCLVIAGQFVPPGYPVRVADAQIKECLLDVFGYQQAQAGENGRTIHVLLDSPGGSLDSAFKIVRYLTWYFSTIHVYVPRRAKSASTLIALGASRIHLSPFGELGPLDAQIHDPRNPANFVSALDCYQSVDYVRQFGITTMSRALGALGDDARGQIGFVDLLDAAAQFGIGAIKPMLEGVKALDFGSWGRSLQIGEKYAQQVLKDNSLPEPGVSTSPDTREQDRAVDVAARLVYRYPHHLYFLDYREVKEIGLDARVMDRTTYDRAMKVVEVCEDRLFVDFVSDAEVRRRKEAGRPRTDAGKTDAGKKAEHGRRSKREEESRPAEPPSRRQVTPVAGG